MSLFLKKIDTPFVSFSTPIPSKSSIFVCGTSASLPSQIIEVHYPSGNYELIACSKSPPIESCNVSKAEPFSFPTTDGKVCHGYFYPPQNSNYEAPSDELPPLRVLVHGGPTGITFPSFSKEKVFWTSQGYAIFDINYRGSFGYGRQYRDALLNKWGLLEIQDVKDGIEELQRKKLINSNAFVSGGSAGGYTVQRLLTYYPDLFMAGASHYGVGSLVTLQRLTHKYESHYLEQLIGGTLESNLEEYNARSPINFVSRLKSPMILFQGTEDKMVPPETSREVAAILHEKHIPYEYHEYEKEGHGFLIKENKIDALKKESQFFKHILQGKYQQK